MKTAARTTRVTWHGHSMPEGSKTPKMRDMIGLVVAAARDAGQVIEAHKHAGVGRVREKDAGQGPVTEADRAADAFLHERLREICDAGWLSEETADNPVRLGHEAVWVVDPLDGTIEFVAGRPEYAVSVALVERGEPALGVVHRPATGDTVWATRGSGTWRNGERTLVRESRELIASRTEVDRGEFAPFTHAWHVRPHGSIAWKLAMVATGEAAGTLSRGPKWEWDVCAGALLVTEAGGRVTDVFGNPLRFNQEMPRISGIIAAAPQAYELLRPTLDAAGPSDRMAPPNPAPPRV